MPYCMKCGEKLPHDAKFCPRCGTPIKPIVEKKSMKRKVLLIAVGVFILLLIIGFSAYQTTREVGTISTPIKSPSKLVKVWEYKVDWIVDTVAISPDGNYIAASCICEDKLVFLTNDGRVLWKKDCGAVDMAISMNGTYILVGDSGGYVNLFDKNGELLWKKQVSQITSVCGVAISYDGKYIAVASYRYVHFFDENGNELWNYTTIGDADDVAISADGERIVVVDDKGYINLLDRKGNLLWDKKLCERCASHSRVAISSNGERICFGINVDEVGIIDKDGNWILKPTSIRYGVHEVDITKDGKFIAVASDFEYVYLLNDKGKTIDTFKAREKVNDVSISQDGTYIVVGSDDLRIYLLRAESS